MKKNVIAVLVLLFLATGWAALFAAEVPVISQSFASREIRPGDTWKVYLKASAPQGEMKNIFATVDQPGVGAYPVSMIRIKPENRKDLSGYIYLNTSSPRATLEFVTLTLTVQIQDGAGNFSQPVVFPLSFNSRSHTTKAENP